MQSSLTRVPRRRLRAALSCHECHRRKVKCDRKNPCARCITSRVPCTYDSSRSNNDPALKLSPASVDHAESLLKPPMLHGKHQDSSNIVVPYDIASRNLLSEDEGGNDTLLQRHGLNSTSGSPEPSTQDLQKNLEPSNHKVRDINRINVDTMTDFKEPSTVPPRTAHAVLNKNRVFGQSHWMNAASEFQFLTRSLIIPSTKTSEDTELNSARKDASTLLYKCKMLARELKQDRPGRTCDTLTHVNFEPISRDAADQSLNMYISCFESVFRVLHLPTLRVEYERYWVDRNNGHEATQLRIRLCLAIGSSLLENGGDTLATKTAARVTISAAQCWFSAPFEKNRLTIDGLQMQCLLLLARHIFTIGGDLTWVSAGTLMHSAIQMGLNRDPESFPNLSQIQIQIRRRLWATILELSLQASLDAGTFPLFRMEDFNTIAPANVNDADLMETGDTASNEPDNVPTDTSLQRLLLMSFPLRLQIVRCMNAPNPEMSHEKAMRIATDLKSFCQNLRYAIHPQDRMKQFKHNMADFLLRRFILSLHHPFANQARQSPQYHYSRKICLDAAMAILSPPKCEIFYRLVLVGGGMFKIRLRHLALALGSELMSDIHDNGSLHTAYREMVLQALKQARADALKRTGFGDTSARLNLLSSMIIKRAELADREEGFELNLIQAAKIALEQSYDILRSQTKHTTHSANEGSSTDLSMDLLPEFNVDFDEFMQLGIWNTGIAMEDWSIPL